MTRCYALVAILIAVCHPTVTAAAEKPAAEPRVVIPRARAACVWTGKEMLLWSGQRRAFALDPEKNAWRAVAVDPYPGRVLQQELLSLADGSVLAAYWVAGEKTRLCFDRCLPDTGQWRHMAQLGREEFKNEKGEAYRNLRDTSAEREYVQFPLEISGMAALAEGAAVFVAPNSHLEPVIGVRVAPSGTVSFISREGAPPCSNSRTDTAVYGSQGKVLYFSYARVDANVWGVWDEKSSSWSKPEEEDRRYSFGHCQAGEEVYVFGGAESSAFGWIKRDGQVFSFRDCRWRPMPVDGGPPGRRDCAMCWTGKTVLVWGGEAYSLGRAVEDKERGATQVPLNAVMGFDPATRAWRVLPGAGAPDSRAHSSTVWTGKEMIVWGGRSDRERCADGYAFNPQLGRWRRLPEPPKDN